MIKFGTLKKEWMKDPEFRKEYDALAAEFTLTEEQVAEVRRRRASPDRKLVSHAEARKRINKLGTGSKR